MKNSVKKIDVLLRKYNHIASEILGFNQSFWDSMHSDIEGYCYDKINDIDIDIEALEKQVKTAEALLKALKNLNYIYG